MELTRANVIDYVRKRLGYPKVAVELEDVHIEAAIEDTLLLFNRYIGEYVHQIYYSQIGVLAIDLSAIENVRGVLRVEWQHPIEERIGSHLSVFELMMRMMPILPIMSIGEYWYQRSFIDTYRRIRGGEVDFTYRDWDKHLMVDCQAGPWDIMVTVVKDITMATINTGRPTHKKAFLDAVLAFSKITLTRIRGKFAGSIPAPGGTLATDTAELRDEAAKALESVEEILTTEARYETPIMWGGS